MNQPLDSRNFHTRKELSDELQKQVYDRGIRDYVNQQKCDLIFPPTVLGSQKNPIDMHLRLDSFYSPVAVTAALRIEMDAWSKEILVACQCKALRTHGCCHSPEIRAINSKAQLFLKKNNIIAVQDKIRLGAFDKYGNLKRKDPEHCWYQPVVYRIKGNDVTVDLAQCVVGRDKMSSYNCVSHTVAIETASDNDKWIIHGDTTYLINGKPLRELHDEVHEEWVQDGCRLTNRSIYKPSHWWDSKKHVGVSLNLHQDADRRCNEWKIMCYTPLDCLEKYRLIKLT
jgi:hypothetical protein